MWAARDAVRIMWDGFYQRDQVKFRISERVTIVTLFSVAVPSARGWKSNGRCVR